MSGDSNVFFWVEAPDGTSYTNEFPHSGEALGIAVRKWAPQRAATESLAEVRSLWRAMQEAGYRMNDRPAV